jgi:prepilin-type N-terminal cleavage/methylation domain-containing protein
MNTRDETAFRSQAQHGFTLVEVLISLVVILFSFMAALTVLTSSYKSGAVAETQTLAVFLAETKLEELAHSTPDDLKESVAVVEYFDRHGWSGDGDNPLPAASRYFTRTLEIKRNAPTRITNEVTVKVEWPERKQPIVYKTLVPAKPI